MISYREDYGYYWPDYAQKHSCYLALMKHKDDMRYAASKCKNNRVCIQAGGNIGVWPIALANLFQTVYTFEPVAANYTALVSNVSDAKCENVIYSNAALSSHNGTVLIGDHESIGSQKVGQKGHSVVAKTIDSLGLVHCDAIFLDVEGHELPILLGAMATIDGCRPVIQVERERDTTDVHDLLLSWGYWQDRPIGKDMVYLP